MSDKTAFLQLREQAIALRRAGKSRREIKEMLAITSNWTLGEALRGEPPQPWTWRPNAKDDLRAKARTLREQGHDYNRIGMPQEKRRGRPQVLGCRAAHPRGRAGSGPRRRRGPDRQTE
jgi:hypothetical protein